MKAKGRSRLLRATETAEEKQLWDSVKNRGLGPKFRRQYPITFVYREEPHCFIADFYCAEGRLIIELDGEFHSTRSDYDGYRTFLIETLGFKIIRFSNSEIRRSFSTVKKKQYQNYQYTWRLTDSDQNIRQPFSVDAVNGEGCPKGGVRWW